jgi:outer membrane protein OmpA-like peptidoglycan-associated protein
VHELNREAEERPQGPYKPEYISNPDDFLSRDSINSIVLADSNLQRAIEVYKPELYQKITNNEAVSSRDSVKISEIISENIDFTLEITSVNSSEFPGKITLYAVVKDHKGNYVSGLAPPYLADSIPPEKIWKGLKDSCMGIPYPIENFTVREFRENSSQNHAFVIVLDHSPSMGNELSTLLQKAVRMLLYSLKAGDKTAVVKFAEHSYLEVPLSDDPDTYKYQFVIEGINESKYGTGTALYDAVNYGINLLDTVSNDYKKSLIIFSDGGDGLSDSNIDSVITNARAKGVALYTIAYKYSAKVMADMAQFTGGRYYRLYSRKEFPYVFRDIYYLMNNHYRIEYDPPDCESIHIATVNAEIPGLYGYAVSGSGEYDKSVFTEYDQVGTVRAENIEFDFGSAEINPESYPIIENVAEAMRQNEAIFIQVVGHTDNVGSEKDNRELSLDRARSVKSALVGLGIDSKRIRTAGKGESEPIAPNDTDENRRKNRRTEFIIIGKR